MDGIVDGLEKLRSPGSDAIARTCFYVLFSTYFPHWNVNDGVNNFTPVEHNPSRLSAFSNERGSLKEKISLEWVGVHSCRSSDWVCGGFNSLIATPLATDTNHFSVEGVIPDLSIHRPRETLDFQWSRTTGDITINGYSEFRRPGRRLSEIWGLLEVLFLSSSPGGILWFLVYDLNSHHFFMLVTASKNYFPPIFFSGIYVRRYEISLCSVLSRDSDVFCCQTLVLCV